jgi:hypothetical protein
MPRWLMRSIGWVLLMWIALIPATRGWIIDQAQEHVRHDVQPLLDNLTEVPVSSKPADPPQ